VVSRNPDATLVAGATDVGLWVTKQLRDLPKVAFLNRARDLARIEVEGDRLRFGAGVTMTEVLEAVRDRHPSWAGMILRYGSSQVRNAATIGGNVANGSPIGDNPPALIALGATLHLRRGEERREMPVEAFFLDYGKQDRRPGEFVEAITVPASAPAFRVYKLSKRFDQDISAGLRGVQRRVEDGHGARGAHRLRRHGGGAQARARRSRRRWSGSPGRCDGRGRPARLCAGLRAALGHAGQRRVPARDGGGDAGALLRGARGRANGHPEGRAMSVGCARRTTRPCCTSRARRATWTTSRRRKGACTWPSA
jgi:CO/xanthine dehydrogenase FAD-binding subunit